MSEIKFDWMGLFSALGHLKKILFYFPISFFLGQRTPFVNNTNNSFIKEEKLFFFFKQIKQQKRKIALFLFNKT
jgi:hypothetical protein